MQQLPRVYVDMMGREITVNFPPKRIISLVPSQTELLYDLGLNAEVVGITKFCVHPQEWFRNKKRVGGTKTLHIDIVKELQPDLIIANKEENTKEQIEELSANYPVWISDIKTIAEGLEMIRQIGILTGTQGKALHLTGKITEGFNKVTKTPKRPKRIAYFIWRKPWMCAGADTFISDVIKTIGWHNVITELRYPETDLEVLANKSIDLILLSSEPYPFKDAHIAEIKAALPGTEVMLVDGEMFSWYGSRMLEASHYLLSFIQ